MLRDERVERHHQLDLLARVAEASGDLERDQSAQRMAKQHIGSAWLEATQIAQMSARGHTHRPVGETAILQAVGLESVDRSDPFIAGEVICQRDEYQRRRSRAREAEDRLPVAAT
ncbi:Uncharacterised protein [Mycobacteroides abscessus subsp. abscessus]|nr:Uncharacterised protein [Mycobacteroides abscessus subsp. abscessus]